MIEQFDVVIRDHDGVVHHHPKHHNQCGDRHLVQFDAESVQQAEGRRNGHRNRHGGNQRHTERQQQHRDQDHRGDGDPKLADKTLHAVRDHRGLVGNEIDLQVGWQKRTQGIQGSVKLLAEVHDVVAFLHLHREQHRPFAS